MRLEEILRLPQFSLPHISDGQQTFQSYFDSVTQDYIDKIDTSSDLFDGISNHFITKDILSQTIQSIRHLLLTCISSYRSGNRPACDEALAECMNRLFKSYILTNNQSTILIKPSQIFFRGRKVLSPYTIQPIEYFFHAPFNLDDKVSTGRFSYPGVPFLYLSNGLIVSFHELRSQSLDELQAVQISPKTLLKFLKLDYRQKTLGDFPSAKEYEEYLQFYALMYPIYLACFCVPPSDSLHPQEYIVPQSLCDWLRKNSTEFNGIHYPSTRIYDPAFSKDFICVVIPPVTSSDSGYCPVLKGSYFKMSNVCAWNHHLHEIKEFIKNFGSKDTNKDILYINWPNVREEYSKTEIGQMEYFLREKFPPEDIKF